MLTFVNLRFDEGWLVIVFPARLFRQRYGRRFSRRFQHRQAYRELVNVFLSLVRSLVVRMLRRIEIENIEIRRVIEHYGILPLIGHQRNVGRFLKRIGTFHASRFLVRLHDTSYRES
jgi:hypothetical protein